MELRAIVEAMSWASNHSKSIKILTDSNYCYKGITEWLPGWIKKGWKTASGTPVKNSQLWKQIDMLLVLTDCTFEKVKGHSDNQYNNKADEVCNTVLDRNN